jgi:hypothetical protein
VRPLRTALSIALVALAAGCGSESTATVADTEGLYLDINGLKYQIEMSRYMNQNDTEDKQYLIGLPPNTSEDETRPAANQWEIHDTLENVYRPIAVDADVNPFVYKAVDVPPKTVLPLASSAAGEGPIQGSLLLFKLKLESLQNRPLELKFSNGGGSTEGTYDLDL